MKDKVKSVIIIILILVGMAVIAIGVKSILEKIEHDCIECNLIDDNMVNIIGNNVDVGYENRVKDLLADDKEVERKWLIKKEDIPYDLKGKDVYKYEIEQTYLCFDPEMRVRRYNGGESYEYTIKTNMTKDGMVRDEYNITINKEQYENLVKKQEGITIHKTRYQFYDNGQVIAIDIFHGDLDGLAYMEIEFKTEEESKSYKEPDWVIKDVTSNKNYKNGYLARYGIPKEK